MYEKMYGRATVKVTSEELNNAGGITIKFDSVYPQSSASFADVENIKNIAANAVRTADNLFDLVMEKCNIDDLYCNKNLEIYIALSSLACEIYMKSAIYFNECNDNKQIKKHKLDLLFKMLPQDVQNELKNNFENIENDLKEISDYFTKFRYDFEFNAFNANLFSFDLMRKMHEICHRYKYETNPELFYYGTGKGISIK